MWCAHFSRKRCCSDDSEHDAPDVDAIYIYIRLASTAHNHTHELSIAATWRERRNLLVSRVGGCFVAVPSHKKFTNRNTQGSLLLRLGKCVLVQLL